MMNLNPSHLLQTSTAPPPEPDQPKPGPTPNTTKTTNPASSEADSEEIARLSRIAFPKIDADSAFDPSLPHDPGEAPPPEPEQISYEAFHEVFCMVFNMPGLFLPVLKPLAIQPGEEEPSRAASWATYRLLQIYYPAALFEGSETFGLLVQLAPFLMVKLMAVRSIVAALKAPQEPKERREAGEDRAKPDRKASNTNAPPSGRVSEPLSWMDAEAAA